ncbi:putative Voltage-gated calcium channel protein, partial [Diplonema papillatum]
MDSSVQRRSLGVADDFVRSGNGSSGLDLAAVTSLPQPDERSLFCLSVDNPLRALCIQVYTTKKFALAILVVILLNSLLMLVTYSVPCDEKHPCLQEVAYWIDLVFSTCFTLEMLVKIIALGGVLHSQSYFRTGWNVLDFITVIGSLVSLTGAGSNVSILRLLRVLRPLRTMSRVAGLRNLMGALFAAVPEIRDNVILIMFLVIIFGILGVQLFGGALHNRCYIMAFDDTLYPDEVNSSGFMLHGEPPYLLPTSNIHCGGSFSCSQASLAPLNASNVACRRFTSLYEETPLSFDDLGGAILLVFKVFSGDDWPENMVALMNATSPHAWVYFFMCIMVGGLFATNLFLAVLISAYYTNAKKAEDSIEDRQKRAQAAWSRIMSQPLMKAPLSTRRGSVAAGLRTLACTLPLSTASQSRRQSLLHYNAREAADNMRSATGTTSQEEQLMLRIRDTAMLPGSVIIPENDIAFSAKASDHTCRDNENPQRTESNELSVYLPTENIVDDPDIDSGLPPALIPAISTIHAPTAPTSVPSHVCPQPPPITFDSHKPNPPSSECGILRGSTKDLSGTARKRCSFTASLPDDAGLDALPITTHPSHINNDDGFTIQQERESEARNHCEPSFSCNGEQKNAIPTSEAINITSLVLHPLAHLPVSPIMRDSYVDDRESVHGPRRCLFTTQDAIAAVVLHPYSEWFVLSVTFVNVLALALDYYGIDRTFAAVLDWIGMVCTIIFTAEIVLKLFAMGPKNCMSDRYNVFDAFLVGVSLPDLVTGGSSAFSAFRAFRMFRALRYVQRWPSIYNLLLALIGCLNEAMYVA